MQKIRELIKFYLRRGICSQPALVQNHSVAGDFQRQRERDRAISLQRYKRLKLLHEASEPKLFQCHAWTSSTGLALFLHGQKDCTMKVEITNLPFLRFFLISNLYFSQCLLRGLSNAPPGGILVWIPLISCPLLLELHWIQCQKNPLTRWKKNFLNSPICPSTTIFC